MKLNREQIIKALEYCNNPNRGSYCPQSDCPYGDVGSCEQLLRCHALSLIKELTEENERLRVKGEWIPYRTNMQYCSVCKAVGDGGNYCSYCGAKMKGE